MINRIQSLVNYLLGPLDHMDLCYQDMEVDEQLDLIRASLTKFGFAPTLQLVDSVYQTLDLIHDRLESHYPAPRDQFLERLDLVWG